MGINWTMALYNYVSDDGNTYIVPLRIEKGATGNFVAADPGFKASRPAQLKMRYVIGINLQNGAVHKQEVANPGDFLFTQAPFFIYNTITYTVSARIAERRPNRK